MNVRLAQTSDTPAIRQFLARASWRFAAFGDEDLPLYLAGRDGCQSWLAEDGGRPAGLLVLSTRRPVWADVRGLALAQTQVATLHPLFNAARSVLAAGPCRRMMCVATAGWLPRVLNAAGFITTDRIVTFERSLNGEVPPCMNDGRSHIVPAGGASLDAILNIDGAAFSAMWQMERREMMTYILTASHTAIIERNGQPVGYAVTYVHDDAAQIIRLAVHPRHQGQGMGRMLLLDALHYCQVKGARRATLNTQESNEVSQRLYRSVDFRPVGRPVAVLVSKP